jgi:outer membrane protein assembly factor BamA
VDQAFGLTQYPLNQSQRFEFTAGFTRQTVSGQRFVTTLTPQGQVVDQRRERIRASDFNARANNSAQVSAAFVGDYSVFGLTSPIAGGRYRFEVTPNFIDQRFVQATADYRRYLFLRPVTFAVRGLHLGRYGGNADSLSSISNQQNFSAVQPLYVGFPTLVRGYDIYSGNFNAATECGTGGVTGSGCPAFERLFGSRVGVVSAEFRIPLLAPSGLGIIPTNILPVDIVPFADAGVAWTGNEPPNLRFVTGDAARNTAGRIPVVSAGVSARINLLGFAVVEAFYAHPFQRPDKPWVLGFQLAPGW